MRIRQGPLDLPLSGSDAKDPTLADRRLRISHLGVRVDALGEEGIDAPGDVVGREVGKRPGPATRMARSTSRMTGAPETNSMTAQTESRSIA